MVEATNPPEIPADMDLNDMTDEQFEAMRKSLPKMTPE